MSLPEIFDWATDATFSSGPATGSPTQQTPVGPEQGLVPGDEFPTEFVNRLLSITGQWVTRIDLQSLFDVSLASPVGTPTNLPASVTALAWVDGFGDGQASGAIFIGGEADGETFASPGVTFGGDLGDHTQAPTANQGCSQLAVGSGRLVAVYGYQDTSGPDIWGYTGTWTQLHASGGALADARTQDGRLHYSTFYDRWYLVCRDTDTAGGESFIATATEGTPGTWSRQTTGNGTYDNQDSLTDIADNGGGALIAIESNGSGTGSWVSTNGTSWTLFEDATVVNAKHIVYSPYHGEFFVVTNDGDSYHFAAAASLPDDWTQEDNFGDVAAGGSLDVARIFPYRQYMVVVTSGKGGGTPGVYYTADLGATWKVAGFLGAGVASEKVTACEYIGDHLWIAMSDAATASAIMRSRRR